MPLCPAEAAADCASPTETVPVCGAALTGASGIDSSAGLSEQPAARKSATIRPMLVSFALLIIVFAPHRPPEKPSVSQSGAGRIVGMAETAAYRN
jgi:hypothetical protein